MYFQDGDVLELKIMDDDQSSDGQDDLIGAISFPLSAAEMDATNSGVRPSGLALFTSILSC